MRARRGLVGLLAAQAVSLTGTRVSMIALPWFVLVTTGSASRTGLVAFCEMFPYVVAKALSGPVIDRVGPRRVSIAADLVSVPVVGAIPLLHALGLLPFGALLGLVAAAGLARGPGDAAKATLIPDVAAAADVPLSRVTGLYGTVDRLAQTVGPLLGGVLVAALGPLTALLADAASFAVGAAVIAATAPRRRLTEPEPEPESGAGARDRGGDRYLARLRAGLEFLRGDRLLRSIITMVATVNLIEAAVYAVLLPVWATTHGGPATIGLLGTAFGATAILGSTVAAAVADQLPRRTTYFVAFVACGPTPAAALALDLPVWAVAVLWAASGAGSGLINPILSAVIYERIPRPLLGRVSALSTTLAWAGIPLGGPVGGALVTLVGLTRAALACACAYLLATALPALRPEWRELDDRRALAASSAASSPEPRHLGT